MVILNVLLNKMIKPDHISLIKQLLGTVQLFNQNLCLIECYVHSIFFALHIIFSTMHCAFAFVPGNPISPMLPFTPGCPSGPGCPGNPGSPFSPR